MICAYCGEQAVLRIPSTPDQVCHAHAVEFWTGLLAYAKTCAESERPEAPSQYWTCNQLSAPKAPSAAATPSPAPSLAPSPWHDDSVSIRSTLMSIQPAAESRH